VHHALMMLRSKRLANKMGCSEWALFPHFFY
jgi:hypothetical protein